MSTLEAPTPLKGVPTPPIRVEDPKKLINDIDRDLELLCLMIEIDGYSSEELCKLIFKIKNKNKKLKKIFKKMKRTEVVFI